MRILWIVLIIIIIFFAVSFIVPAVVEWIQNEKERKEKEKRKNFPLIYSHYRGDLFPDRIQNIYEALQGMRGLGDYVDAKAVMNKIEEAVSFVEQKVYDAKFNAFLKTNPNEFDNASEKLFERLETAKRACYVLGSAFTLQEVSVNQERLTEIIQEAEKILANQTKSDEELMQEIEHMQDEQGSKSNQTLMM